ncbi:MAG: hypothetical protein H0T54_09235 [Geodermatophilaceae bacterium]|nr:hypothetical protein [Geodermatophilaceae bacterium]
MRIYVPSTTTELTILRDEGELRDPRAATAVTAELSQWYVDTDLEELEYAAMLEAARLSLRMVDSDPTAARRRVVVTVEVPDKAVELDPKAGRGSVRLLSPLSLAEVVSLQVDGPDAEAAVIAAAAVVIEADLGSDDAQFIVDEAEAHELGWYATQELGPLLELL